MDYTRGDNIKAAMNLTESTTELRCSSVEEKSIVQNLEEYLDAVIGYGCVGRDAQTSRLNIQQAIEEEIYKHPEKLRPGQMLQTGSLFEGMPTTVCGDIDMMFTSFVFPVVYSTIDQVKQIDSEEEISYPVVAVSDTDNPVFLRLSVPETTKNVHFASLSLLSDITETYGGIRYVSSEKFVQIQESEGGHTHGPAKTRPIDLANPTLGEMDTVPCLKSLIWPDSAYDFYRRPRQYNWPSKELVDQIKQAGCHVVGVGRHNSSTKRLEWRWSFSMAEKILIQGLPEPVAQCMYILKAVKSNVFKTDESPAICSYFIKTACLLKAEESDPNDAANQTPIGMAKQVLDWLINKYRNRYLPHYFVPRQNLIGHLPAEDCDSTANLLDKVRANFAQYVLESVPKDARIQSELEMIAGRLALPDKQPTGSTIKTLVATLKSNSEDTTKALLKEFTEHITSGSKFYKEQTDKQIARFLSSYDCLFPQLIDYLIIYKKSSKMLPTLPEQIIQPVINMLENFVPNQKHRRMFLTYLRLYLGEAYHCFLHYYKNLASNYKKYLGDANQAHAKAEEYYMTSGKFEFEDGWDDKGLTSYAHLAKFYQLNGEYEKTDKILKEIQPLMDDMSKDWEICNKLPALTLGFFHKVNPWETDKLVYKKLGGGTKAMFADLNPVSVILFIQGKRAIQSRQKKLAEQAIQLLETSKLVICRPKQQESHQKIIEALNEGVQLVFKSEMPAK